MMKVLMLCGLGSMEANAVQLLQYLSDITEMIAALAALGVSWLMYREVHRDRKDQEKNREE